MSPILVFGLLLIVTFGVLVYFLKPSSTEVAVEQQLAGMEGSQTAVGGPTTILKQEAFSSNKLLDELIKQLPWSAAVSRLLRQAGQTWSVASVTVFSLVALIVGWWLSSLFIPLELLSVGIGIALSLSPYIFLYFVREARFRKFDAVLPEAVDLMSRGLRAGHSINAVLEMVGNEVADPVGSEFRALHKEQTLGLPMREAMTKLVERMPRDDMRFIATAILLQKESGGNLAQILDKTAVVVRERARLRGQLQIYTAQGRITGWILCFAPFGMFALISLVNKDYVKLLFTEPMGRHMVYGALAMMVAGVLIIRKIIDIKV
jgi:tight adherence protein B